MDVWLGEQTNRSGASQVNQPNAAYLYFTCTMNRTSEYRLNSIYHIGTMMDSSVTNFNIQYVVCN